jgi:hypothetical protein
MPDVTANVVTIIGIGGHDTGLPVTVTGITGHDRPEYSAHDSVAMPDLDLFGEKVQRHASRSNAC